MKKFLFGLTVIAIATLGVVKAIDVNASSRLAGSCVCTVKRLFKFTF